MPVVDPGGTRGGEVVDAGGTGLFVVVSAEEDSVVVGGGVGSCVVSGVVAGERVVEVDVAIGGSG
jgi:hypothetical protein